MCNDSLLVETSSAVQSEMLLKATQMLTFGIAVERCLPPGQPLSATDNFDLFSELPTPLHHHW